MDYSVVVHMCEKIKFDSEYILHKLTEKYIKEKELFGLKYVGSEIQYDKLRIDTLAFDEDKNTFVIIEYKNKKDKNVIKQVQGYYNLIKEGSKKADIHQELAKLLGKEKNEIDFNNIQAKIIAPKFTDGLEEESKDTEYLELYIISLCKCDDEKHYVSYEKCSDENMHCDSKVMRYNVNPKDLEITKEDMLKNKSKEIKTLYNDFESSLLNQFDDNDIDIDYLVDAVSIKAHNNFICNVDVKKSIKIIFYTHKLNEINKQLDKDSCRKKNIRNIAYLTTGGPLAYFELTLTPCDIDYAINMIKQIKRKKEE